MSPEQRKALHERARALLLSHPVIAAQDRVNEAREVMHMAIAKARVSSEIELMDDADGDE